MLHVRNKTSSIRAPRGDLCYQFLTDALYPMHLCHQGRTFTTPSFPIRLLVWEEYRQPTASTKMFRRWEQQAADNSQLNVTLSKYWCFWQQPRLCRAQNMQITNYILEKKLHVNKNKNKIQVTLNLWFAEVFFYFTFIAPWLLSSPELKDIIR